jgi:hypothetical protein
LRTAASHRSIDDADDEIHDEIDEIAAAGARSGRKGGDLLAESRLGARRTTTFIVVDRRWRGAAGWSCGRPLREDRHRRW